MMKAEAGEWGGDNPHRGMWVVNMMIGFCRRKIQHGY